MAFQMNCPHCRKMLNITEKAFGQTLPCPGCGKPLTVPQPPVTRPASTPSESKRAAARTARHRSMGRSTAAAGQDSRRADGR